MGSLKKGEIKVNLGLEKQPCFFNNWRRILMDRGKNALLVAHYRTGFVKFTKELVALGWQVFSFGETAKILREALVPVVDIAKLPAFSPIAGHSFAALFPRIQDCLLFTEECREGFNQLGHPLIDLVYVDFYRFKKGEDQLTTLAEAVIENDINELILILLGIKGQRFVVVDPADRLRLIEWLKSGRPDETEFKNALTAKAEAAVANFCLESARSRSGGAFDGIIGRIVKPCKYGENAWQRPSFLYSNDSDDPLALDKFIIIEGTDLSYNNWVDLDRSLQTMSHIVEGYAINECDDLAIAVGVKHGNPCGAATGSDREEVLEKMMAGDPLAIFGGLIMVNFEIEEKLYRPLVGKMLDAIVAPSFTPGAVAILRRKSNKCRFITNPALGKQEICLDQAPRLRYVRGGFLTQPNYTFVPSFKDDKIAKYGVATPVQKHDMMLAWAVGSTSNSNAVTLVKNGQLIGNGVGQQDRVGAAQLAISRAKRSGHNVAGAVAYSDSFFPFPDGPQALIEAGVTAIFTSSGSIRDQATIDICKKSGVVLYMIPDQIGRGFFGH
jgi:phosphoribosylaminoimidazolecarboxamide formyltransferase/IMP cyclohydrolase